MMKGKKAESRTRGLTTEALKIDRELDPKEEKILEILSLGPATKGELDFACKDLMSSGNTVTKYLATLKDELKLISWKTEPKVAPSIEPREVYFLTERGKQAYRMYQLERTPSVFDILKGK